MKIKEIKSKLSEFDKIELPDKEAILGNALKEENSGTEEVRLPRLRRRPRFVPAAAVGLLLVCAVAVWISRTTVTQAKNYRDAVEFFEKYELSAEGLSRDDITEVYFDIIKGTFSSEKTKQVIHKRVLVHDITQDITASEQTDVLWENIKNSTSDTTYDNVISYEVQIDYDFTQERKSTFTQYENGKEKWKIDVDFTLYDFDVVGGCIILCGDDIRNFYDKDGRPSWSGKTRIAAVDMQGEILWEHEIQHGYEWESYVQMAAGEQLITVFSRAEEELIITSFDYKGNCVNCLQNNELLDFCEETDGTVQKTECYGEYIYAKICGSGGGTGYFDPKYYIVKMNHEGHILETLNYTADGTRYDIEDMIEFNGKLYLSGFSYESEDGEWVIDPVERAVHEIKGDNIFEEFSQEEWEELRRLTREIVSAALLVCDVESGNIQEAYRVKGAKGGKLVVNEEGKLIWEVESIDRVIYEPYMSSHIFDIFCQVYSYTFDGSGMLTDSDKTDKNSHFWF